MAGERGERGRRFETVIAGALYGALFTGAVGLVLGVAAAVGGEFWGAGLCMVGAALAFGLLANACLRQ